MKNKTSINHSTATDGKPPVMHSAYTTTEICENRNGKVVVKYRRAYGSEEAQKLIDEVNALPKGTTYFVRHCA